MNDDQLLAQVTAHIKKLAQNTVEGEITPDTKILSEHVIDSLGIIELITFIESNYQIKMAQDELTMDNLDSIRAIVTYIKRKKQ